MIRDTSKAAYLKIKKDGLIGALQWSVYSCLYSRGPMTQMECAENIESKRVSKVAERGHGITPRFAELERRGVISCLGKRTCRVTGYQAYEWDVTSKLPVKPPKRKSNVKIIKELETKNKNLIDQNWRLVKENKSLKAATL